MKLDEQFKQLKNHPPNERLQQHIRQNLAEKKQRKQWNVLNSRFGEFSFVLVFLVLGSFLLFTALNDTKQATSDSIEAIYSYESSDTQDPFRAKPSTNYLGMENITTNSWVLLFETLDDFPIIEPQAKQYGDYELIVVYENGEQRRFELAENYLYDIDAHIYYPGYNQFPATMYKELYDAHHAYKLPEILLPLLIILIIGVTSFYYQRKKIEVPRENKSMYIAIAIYIVIVMSLFYYVYNIGLLYFPLLFMIILGIAYTMWWPIKREVTNPIILRVEKLKIIALVISVVIFLIWG